MRLLFTISACTVLVASPATSAPAPSESWGKAGVTYDQYRLDAFECSSEGYNFDISRTEAAQAFVEASRRLETEIGAPEVDPYTYQTIVNNARPDVHLRDIKHLQLSVVDQCLAKRGYIKFRLNEAQRHGLKRLKVGSTERHMFLYRLGTDPKVLSTQLVPPK